MSIYGGYGTPPEPAAPTATELESAPAPNAFKAVPTKRKRAEFDPDPNDHFYDPAYIRQQTQTMIQLLKTYTDENGSRIYEPFLRLPDKQAFPDYYQIVKRPVSMAEVETRLANNEYPSLQPARDDLNQMFNNAKHYNQNGSDIYNAAQKLQKALKVYWKSLKGPDSAVDVDSPVVPVWTPQIAAPPPAKRGRPTNAYLEAQAAADPVKAWMQSTLKKLIDLEDEEGRPHSEFFMVLPSRDIFPDYYQVIEHPIAFSQLQSKVKKGNYSNNYEAFIRDVQRIFQNAKTYNDESAIVYKDAEELERLFLKLQQSSPVRPAAPAQPKVTLRFGQSNRSAASATPAAESSAPTPPPATQPQSEKITLKFGGGGGNSSAKASPAATASPLPHVHTNTKVESPAPSPASAHTKQGRSRQHAQIFLPPKIPNGRLSMPSREAPRVSARAVMASQKAASSPASTSSVQSTPLPPPIAQRVPKTLAQLGSSTHPLLPVLHIRPHSDSDAVSVLLNGFLRQHSITVSKHTNTFDIIISNSVAPLPSTSKQEWPIAPPAGDPCIATQTEDKPQADPTATDMTLTRSSRQSKGRQPNPGQSNLKSHKLNVVARARPAGTLIREEAVDAERDGPYAQARFSCRLAKHPVSIFEFSASLGSAEDPPQVYRLFVIRAL